MVNEYRGYKIDGVLPAKMTNYIVIDSLKDTNIPSFDDEDAPKQDKKNVEKSFEISKFLIIPHDSFLI